MGAEAGSARGTCRPGRRAEQSALGCAVERAARSLRAAGWARGSRRRSEEEEVAAAPGRAERERSCRPGLRRANFVPGGGAERRRGAAPAPPRRGAEGGSGPGARRAGTGDSRSRRRKRCQRGRPSPPAGHPSEPSGCVSPAVCPRYCRAPHRFGGQTW